jgi:acetyltransferase-like isoleucine patch superfamily enzyme
MILTNYWYFDYTIKNWNTFGIFFLILLPLTIYGYIWEFVFSVASFSALIILILKKIHPIQEGVFPIDGDEFKYYKYRFWVSYFAIWLSRAVPLPWLDFIIMIMLGSKMGKKVCLYDSWMDTELIEIEDNVMTSLNTIIMSHAIYSDKFIQLRTVLKKNSITGGLSLVAPGTILEEGAILGASCSTYIGQHLEANMYHIGNPATKTIPITNVSDSASKNDASNNTSSKLEVS